LQRLIYSLVKVSDLAKPTERAFHPSLLSFIFMIERDLKTPDARCFPIPLKDYKNRFLQK